jgi:hypothetical protein
LPAQEYLIVDYLSTKQLSRIFSKVKINADTGCWEWQASRDKHGYGKISFRRKSHFVHRVIYAWVVGPVPLRRTGEKTAQIDHFHCDNTRCCNPVHLRLCPPRSNSLRSDSPPALAAKKTHCVRGHVLPLRRNRKNYRVCLHCHRIASKKETPEQRERRLIRMRKYHQEVRKWTRKASRITCRS